jgi:hypothetical protein
MSTKEELTKSISNLISDTEASIKDLTGAEMKIEIDFDSIDQLKQPLPLFSYQSISSCDGYFILVKLLTCATELVKEIPKAKDAFSEIKKISISAHDENKVYVKDDILILEIDFSGSSSSIISKKDMKNSISGGKFFFFF